AILYALDAVKSGQFPLQYNLHFFFEGEEEQGSTHLMDIFRKYKSLLQSDLWIICDGPAHPSGYKQVTFGVRGDAHISITTYGSARPLHSGHYGNWAPNPASELVQLLATMKDSSGRVTVAGFYDDTIPLTSAEKAAMKAVPAVSASLMQELAFGREERPGLDLPAAILQPSLNINGIESGHVGSKASNVIPASASAVLDLRLVPGNDCTRQQEKIIAHIRKQGYYVLDHDPTLAERRTHARIAKVIPDKGYNAQRTSMDLPEAKKLMSAIRATTEEQVVIPVISMGGSLPLYLFDEILKVPVMTVSIANYDNNQHAENENIRVGNLWSGIESLAAIMCMP
ncbi:MAG TPA: M20/M25/M40 family metallo-hydrolase, partial [Sediminibacterium sp.]|nr:M20/M25/M40 family metallo-hydrolase [Sediminibacterium sp.]